MSRVTAARQGVIAAIKALTDAQIAKAKDSPNPRPYHTEQVNDRTDDLDNALDSYERAILEKASDQ